jgi:hypothetical protein
MPTKFREYFVSCYYNVIFYRLEITVYIQGKTCSLATVATNT